MSPGPSGLRQSSSDLVGGLDDGRILQDRVEQPLGRTSSNPLPPDLLRGKFVACAGHVLERGHAVEVAAAIERFEAVADVAAFTRMLEPG